MILRSTAVQLNRFCSVWFWYGFGAGSVPIKSRFAIYLVEYARQVVLGLSAGLSSAAPSLDLEIHRPGDADPVGLFFMGNAFIDCGLVEPFADGRGCWLRWLLPIKR